ncbi:hypothetical protein GGR58DRAFT_504262 [Xylaria digitata]|nr:hypothetical protein GGR58DRAFT_504262 [Xylaria digitata]
MASYNLPNWLRIILLILSCLSFLPQILMLLYYVLFNLVVATELFSLAFFFVTNQIDGSDFFVHNPPNVGDWLNLAQFTAVYVLRLLIFVLFMSFSLREKRRQNATVTALCTSYLLISVISVFLNAISHSSSPGERRWFGALFLGGHTLILAPLITILAAATLPVQAHAILALPRGSSTGAVSVTTLAAQTVIFAVLAATWWPGRLVFPEDFGSPVAYFGSWYQLVGFVPVDYAVFALAQAVLFVVATRHRRRGTRSEDLADETDPLLLR